ncbi:MAG: glycosyltransferase family 4 protein [Acetobacteraceae bacterium]
MENGQRAEEAFRIVGLISGGLMGSDPFDPTSWSGISREFFLACQRRGMLERAFGVDVARRHFLALAVTRFHRNREVWKGRIYSSVVYRSALERALQGRIAEQDKRYPIMQLGAYVNAKRVYGAGARVFTYQDGNHEEYLRSGFAPPALAEDRRLSRQCFEFEKRVAESAELVLTTSEYLRRSFIDLYGIPAERVKVLGCGVNFPLPPQSAVLGKDYNSREILFIGKEFVRKGGDALCQAFRIVRRHFPDAVLHIVGPGSIPSEFLSDPGVHVYGFLSRAIAGQREKLAGLFRQSSLFALPSRYEPFGIAPLEAMSHGIPAIVTGRWALGENVTEGRTGFHVAMEDPGGLADRIIAAWADPVRLAAIGGQARSFVEASFTWDRVVDRLEVLLSPPARLAGDDRFPRRV